MRAGGEERAAGGAPLAPGKGRDGGGRDAPRSPGPRPHGGRPAPGLCGSCRHARRIESDRGSVFWLCGRSRTDPSYPRYPRLPVRRCPGHEPGAGEGR